MKYKIIVSYKSEEQTETFTVWSKLEDYAEQKVLLGCTVTIWVEQ